MEPDFSGYATKAGLKCSDGLTIMPDAFRHQDKARVPLVWQHGHNDPENVVGHAILEARADGVYTYGFFNNTDKGKHAKALVEHGDINQLSIWANQLIKRANNVLHGAIREVSLVLSGANPGALIENVTIRHSDGGETELEDEVIIYTGLELEHASADDEVEHADGEEDDDSDEETIQDVYNSMSEKQQQVLHYMVGEALEAAKADMKQSDLDLDIEDDEVRAVYESMNEEQQTVLHHMLNDAIEHGKKITNTDNSDTEGSTMKHNVFEDQGKGADQTVLSHDDMKSIVETAARTGSLKHAVNEYALAHGITDIEVLFPDARLVSDTPEWVKRRTEWVADLLGSVRKSPFSRIKTITADLTYEAARAKGYITGNLKKEEFFPVASRTTTPTTIYKKQALDRDDVVDITDFDVIAWLKAEMRLMLDEELARAILIGDGRDIASEDKINEQNIRPIAKDHELYTTVINVNVSDANSTMTEVVDAVITNRYKYKGTGQPTFYTTEYWIARFMTLRDTLGHRLYKNLGELAAELRVANIVAVEAMLDEPDIIGILVNPVDYVLGADKGGNVSMFDDFDIDYNKQKYLIETRVSGALVKVKSAMVLKSMASTDELVVPAAPTFDGTDVTIVDTTGVVYKDGEGTVINATGSPYTVASGATYYVHAEPASGYYFATSDDDMWAFTNES